MNKTKIVKYGIIFLIVMSALLAMSDRVRAVSDTSDGSFTINAAPQVSAVDYTDDADTPVSSLDPDSTTYYRLAFTVDHGGTMDDLLNCTIWLFDDSVHGSDFKDASPDGIFLTKFQWLEATDVWSVTSQGAMSEWQVDTSGSTDPGTGGAQTTFDFEMRFIASKVARYDTDWNASVLVADDDGTPETDEDSETVLITYNQNYEISTSTATFSWGSNILPDSTNNTHGALSLTIYANYNWEVEVSQNDWTASAETPVDAELEDITAWDQDGSGGGLSFWVRNTPAVYAGSDLDAQSAMSDESGFNRPQYLLLNPAQLFVAGKEWTATFTWNVQADT